MQPFYPPPELRSSSSRPQLLLSYVSTSIRLILRLPPPPSLPLSSYRIVIASPLHCRAASSGTSLYNISLTPRPIAHHGNKQYAQSDDAHQEVITLLHHRLAFCPCRGFSPAFRVLATDMVYLCILQSRSRVSNSLDSKLLLPVSRTLRRPPSSSPRLSPASSSLFLRPARRLPLDRHLHQKPLPPPPPTLLLHRKQHRLSPCPSLSKSSTSFSTAPSPNMSS